MRRVEVKNLFLRLLPYVISLIAGSIVYILADIHISDSGLSTLAVNIASGLISIPLVFIFYEVINNMCTKDIRESIFQHLSFEINYIIIDVIKILRNMLSIKEELTEDSLDDFLHKDKKFIKNSLKKDTCFSDSLLGDKKKLLELIYSNANLAALSDQQAQTILAIAKSLGIIAKEIEQSKNKNIIEENFLELLGLIAKWIDLCEEDAIINHHSFKLV